MSDNATTDDGLERQLALELMKSQSPPSNPPPSVATAKRPIQVEEVAVDLDAGNAHLYHQIIRGTLVDFGDYILDSLLENTMSTGVTSVDKFQAHIDRVRKKLIDPLRPRSPWSHEL